ncbi:MAG: isoprenylcysteine carboxylmethyltransferase family protein [Candidatus Omnitrophota bacterium]|nr:MAG: isoprenylcysteine carboxylmethyltransferase family protein [Candidatus Omnitrophota bacterium]
MATEKNNLTPGQIIFLLIYPLIYPLLILGLSGDWLWPEGWLWVTSLLLVGYAMCIYLFIKDPTLLKERLSMLDSKNQKSWDKILLPIIFIMMLTWLVILPLDAKRFGWSPEFPLGLKITGGVLLAISLGLLWEVYRENTFASPLARVQTERKQTVISSGLYGIVRHPMYASMIIWFFGTAFLLGSLYGVLLIFPIAGLLAIRAVKEEKMLKEELEGYESYMQKVKYRFIPKLW